jgi:hypothetical protein
VYMHMRRDMPGLREPMVLSALKYSGLPAHCRQQNRPTPTGRGNATCRRTQFEGALFFFLIFVVGRIGSCPYSKDQTDWFGRQSSDSSGLVQGSLIELRGSPLRAFPCWALREPRRG